MKKHSVDALAALLLFGIFAACVLSVLLTGAGAYRRLTQRDDRSYTARTAAQYLSTKVRQADAAGQVWVGPFAGDGPADTLFLAEGDYCTRIYYYDGAIWELFASREDEFIMADGERVLDCGGLAFSLEEGLLTARLTLADGACQPLYLELRAGEGGEP